MTILYIVLHPAVFDIFDTVIDRNGQVYRINFAPCRFFALRAVLRIAFIIDSLERKRTKITIFAQCHGIRPCGHPAVFVAILLNVQAHYMPKCAAQANGGIKRFGIKPATKITTSSTADPNLQQCKPCP
jgi:hypothetical protein